MGTIHPIRREVAMRYMLFAWGLLAVFCAVRLAAEIL